MVRSSSPTEGHSASETTVDQVDDNDSRLPGNATRRFRPRNEAARDRDVFNNLCAWQSVYKPATLHLQTETKLASEPPAQQCPDKTLTALAQLCALQLDVRTCLVSLVCRKTEYVLADVSKATPLQQRQQSVPHTGSPWIGTTSFAREDGLLSQAIGEWQKARRPREASSAPDDLSADSLSPHWFIIPDVQSTTRQANFLTRGPWIRFFCTIPLRSSQGSVIGGLTILDDKPHRTVDATMLTALEELSDTVTQHFYTTITRIQQQRSHRMLQGLSSFNNGRHSLRDWWLAQDDVRVDNQGRNDNQDTEGDRVDRVNSEFGLRTSVALDKDPSDDTQQASTTDQAANAMQSSLGSSSPIQPIYDRAANLLREALSVDGVAFISMNSTVSASEHGDSTDEEQSRSDSEESESSSNFGQLCKAYSYSTRQIASVDGHANSANPLRLRERQLRRLVQRYPRGTVLHYEADGKPQISSDEDSGAGSSGQHTAQRRLRSRDVEVLGRLLNGARSAALFPIVDVATGRWQSCAFIWSKEITRYLDPVEDLAYLKTFGHCILAEVSRIESIASDQAKTKFISTVSHELRSPLHAVLAGVEFLKESELDHFQQEMTNTIDMAGKTLLDTVEHILDYSKISKATRAIRVASTEGALTATSTSTEETLPPVTDLASLTESIVETCVSAHRSQMQANAPPLAPNGNISRLMASYTSHYSPAMRDTSDVSVVLNIAYRDHWHVRLQPGAWTRMLTNLLGNALKYTDQGHIAVQLGVATNNRHDNSSKESVVVLTVKDTGIGMSESFLADGLYVPFRQENPHSTGAGLGLSIVSQIAKDTGADLKLSSKRNKGTKFTVRLPVSFMPDSYIGPETAQKEATRMPVDLFNMLTMLPHDDKNSTVEDVVGKSITATAREWMGSEICESMDIPENRTLKSTVCAITERTLRAWQDEKPEVIKDFLAKLATGHSHILVLADCIKSVQPDVELHDLPLKPVFVHQPIGPRKLLQAVASDRDSTTFSSRPPHMSWSSASDNDVSQARRRFLSSGRFGRAGLVDEDTLLSNVTSETSIPSPGSLSTDGLTSLSSITHDTVLLVEDNHINMKLLVALVRKLRLPYQCAINGRDAVEAYRQDQASICLVLMDMSMPVMDGFAATRKIREFETRQAVQRTHIVALTGVTDHESRARAFDCGVDEFYSKPVGIKELRAVLDKVKQHSANISIDEQASTYFLR